MAKKKSVIQQLVDTFKPLRIKVEDFPDDFDSDDSDITSEGKKEGMPKLDEAVKMNKKKPFNHVMTKVISLHDPRYRQILNPSLKQKEQKERRDTKYYLDQMQVPETDQQVAFRERVFSEHE